MSQFEERFREHLEGLLASRAKDRATQFPSGIRGLVVAQLERILVNPHRLDAHCQFLKDRLPRCFEDGVVLTHDQTVAILEHGLVACDDAQLAALLLNPVALYELYDAIDETPPLYWRGLLRQEAHRFCEDQGLVVPAFDKNSETPTLGVTLPLGLVAAVPVDSGVAQTRGGARRWGPFEMKAEDCIWDIGNPAMAAGETVQLAARWSYKRLLEISFGGFLRIDEHTRVIFLWVAADGTERAKDLVEDASVNVWPLEPKDDRPPSPGDRLQIQSVRQPPAEMIWSVRLFVELS